MNSGVNPVGDTVGAELSVQSNSVKYYHGVPLPLPPTAPPPYTASVSNPIVNQPVIHHYHTIVAQPPLQNRPTLYHCPRCNETVLTKVKYMSSQKTHLIAGFICGLTCWCLLCCLATLPYLAGSCKTAEHYCPNCNIFLGKAS